MAQKPLLDYHQYEIEKNMPPQDPFLKFLPENFKDKKEEQKESDSQEVSYKVVNKLF